MEGVRELPPLLPFDVEETISSCLPGKELNLRFAGEGMDSVAWIAAEDWIFRFPKFGDVSENLDKEVELLPKISSMVDIALPHFEHVGKVKGRTFVGYRMLKGEPLLPRDFASFAPSQQNKLYDQLSSFLDQLHSIELAVAKEAKVSESSTRHECERELAAARKHVFPHLPKDETRQIERWCEEYLADEANFDYEPRLLHADLSSEHLIYCPRKEELVGIIDWGDLIITDPAYEFMFLYEEYGYQFVTNIVKRSKKEWGRGLRKKLEFWFRFNWVIDVLIHSKRNRFGEKEAALVYLKKMLAR